MNSIQIHDEAAAEIRQATAWYADIREELESGLKRELDAVIERIQWNPESYAIDDDIIRAALLRRFPYCLYYCDIDGVIWIIALSHNSRKPYYWHNRLQDIPRED